MASTYNIITSSDEATVVAEYISPYGREIAYQSEADLEDLFIKILCEQGYKRLDIHTEKDLIDNLRLQMERLNKVKFSDAEWKRFFENHICKANEGIVEKTRRVQEDYVQSFVFDEGGTKNLKLIDKTNVHNNELQVINQYTPEGGNYDNRYDVTILVNGLPLVHVELKRRGVNIKEAFNQIDRYQRDSFWADSGLFEYIQIFVISNGTFTKYYSNTTRISAIEERKSGKKKMQKTSNSFEFTSYWADANNRVIPDLVDFSRTFFAKHTLLNILTKYCVFTSEELLLVMRPYQITATERIINRIEIANNYKLAGSVEAGGYIWHTTGSGKTLTSFKTAQLASSLPFIDKVIFVVDRKDLDYQTMREYDRFEKGAANGNRSTAVLQRQLEDRDKNGNPKEFRIIVTTIQKLDIFIKKNPKHPVFSKNVVLIFDECHRSQFGEMHARVTKNFKKYFLFGFTGTPIFAVNAQKRGNPETLTTEQLFGKRLHTYTIVDAINDGNVLPFRIDYIDTMKLPENITDKKVAAIDRENALLAPQRISEIVGYILEHFDQKTKRMMGSYTFSRFANVEELAKGRAEEIKKKARLSGFNSILAVSSIKAAKLYYEELKKQLAEHPEKGLKVALIYSYGVNDDDPDGFIDDEDNESTDALSAPDRDFLEDAITDYNMMFHTMYDTSADKFQSYYKDLSLRMKNKEIDILVVVNMFLTGFDATTLNTLWVDKNLKQHGLIQAFSRTNRILNSIKPFGNIVCFRDLQKETDDAIALFGDKDASGIVLLKSYDDYYYGYDDGDKHIRGYVDRIQELLQKFPLSMRGQIMTNAQKKEFLVLFGGILRLRNILSAFDKFDAKAQILTPYDLQDYTGWYIDIHDSLKPEQKDKESIVDDIVFEAELVRQIEVNIDYILALVEKYKAKNCQDKEIRVAIDKAIASSIELRSKKELIEQFVESVNVDTNVAEAWRIFVAEKKELDIEDLISENNLKPDATRKFIESTFEDGVLRTSGTLIDSILPPMSRFDTGSKRKEKKAAVIEAVKAFFDKYFGIF